MVRSSNIRELSSNIKMLPEDIVMAEHLTGGDPNILSDDRFIPEQKADYTELFGTKKHSSNKKMKSEFKKGHNSWKPKSSLPIKSERRSLPALPSTIPRPITHPRFLTKALEGKSDHEVRIRCQVPVRHDYDDPPQEKRYNCHICDFQTTRLNVIVLHNKSHSASFIEAQNARRAELKSKKRDFVSLTCSLKEHTPKSTTSRGRVKSVPKKLTDYTDEPSPKIFKEKLYSKLTLKEASSESSTKNASPKSPEKSPKKIKKEGEKSPIKRPLFGKRKTAKEKAELAAKQKQANEAMKETLLKDWEDDDFFENDVQIDQLNKALQSTIQLDESNSSEHDKPIHKNDCAIIEDDIKCCKETPESADNKAKVFEFDDSEDSLPVTNFRLKNQREKFTDDKFKKPNPPKPLSKVMSKPKLSTILSPISQQESDKDTEELNKAFDSLLEETSVPTLPEIPKSSFSSPTEQLGLSEQTSDISSSTDLVKNVAESANIEESEEETKKSRLDSELELDLKLECTSSGSQEQLCDLPMPSDETEKTQDTGEQKNSNEVSASDPRIEIHTDSVLSGVATTTTDYIVKSDNALGTKKENVKEDWSITEISSTCDIAKSHQENDGNNVLCNEKETLKIDYNNDNEIIKSNYIDSPLEDNCCNNSDIMEGTNTFVDISTPESCATIMEPKPLVAIKTHIELLNEPNTPIETKTLETFDTPVSDTPDDIQSDSDQQRKTKTDDAEIDTPFENPADFQLLTIDSQKNYNENSQTTESLSPSLDQNIVKDSVTINHFSVPTVEESVERKPMDVLKTEQETVLQTNNTVTAVHNDKLTNVDVISTGDIVTTKLSESTSAEVESTQASKIKDTDHFSQNFQDMELDINSMPVIIGGEDFIQSDQPKQNFVPIQPKYSESIVIRPTVTQSPNTSGSVLMQLAESSTSNKQLQPLLSISKKGVKGGSRGAKSQKTTSKAIKIPAATLKNLSAMQKGGNQSVYILKTASTGPGKSDKTNIQKHKGQLNMIQHGNNIIIVDNANIGGQNKIKLNPQQQQLLAGGKLTPGTRVITSKVIATTTSQGTDTISKMTISKSPSKPAQKLVISKADLLSNTTSNSVIINRKIMKNIVPATMVTPSKGQTIITQKMLNKKGSMILPSSSQSTSTTGKTTAIITSQGLIGNKSMIVTPVTNKSGTFVSGNQKFRIVSSKASISGNKLVVQNTQGNIKVDPQHKGQQIKLISGLRGQTSGSNTILIQTSQGFIAKSMPSSSVTTSTTAIRATPLKKTIMTTIPTQTKIKTPPTQSSQVLQLSGVPQSTSVQPAQVLQLSGVPQSPMVQSSQLLQISSVKQSPNVKKVTVPKVKQSPNILQKPQRKTTPRSPKPAGNRLASAAVSVPEQIILSPATSLPSSSQATLVQDTLPPSSDRLVYLTVDESGNYRQIDNKSMISFEGNSEGPQTIFIPAVSEAQDLGNIFLAIDDAGNIVNISQPVSSTTTTHAAPSQDILAKALANTQVLQPETIIPDMDVSAALASSTMDTTILPTSFTEHSHYPAPSLSHSVLETSLTLNQPIMTPLEVPSAVSPNVGQTATLSSNLIPNLMSKQKHNRPSMPLLTDESLASQTGNEAVFVLDGSNIIPATSGSQISFQLTLDDNNVIMTSGADGTSYQIMSDNVLATQIVDSNIVQKIENDKKECMGKNITFSILPEEVQSQVKSEELGGDERGIKSDQFLSNVESRNQHELIHNYSGMDNPNDVDCHNDQVEESFTTQVNTSLEDSEKVHSFKRGPQEEPMITSSSYLENGSKRMRVDDR